MGGYTSRRVHPVEGEEPCFICMQPQDNTLQLACGHRMHAPCAMEWWCTSQQISCALCRAPHCGCYLEFQKIHPRVPVSFIRKDTPESGFYMYKNHDYVRQNNTMVVSIREDARDMAAYGIVLFKCKVPEQQLQPPQQLQPQQ